MKPQIKLISIMTDDVPVMLQFYTEVMGFTCDDKEGEYLELNHDGVRFALCARKYAYELTSHESYTEKSNGQSFELAFWLPTKSDVDKTFTDITDKGATPIMAPHDMPWGQRTAMIADPDGNIHEIYADG